MDKVYLVYLSYDIMFHDSDEGDCHAGDGQIDLGLYSNEPKAQAFIDDYKKIIETVKPELSKPVHFQRYNDIEDMLLLKRGQLSDIDLSGVRINYKPLVVK